MGIPAGRTCRLPDADADRCSSCDNARTHHARVYARKVAVLKSPEAHYAVLHEVLRLMMTVFWHLGECRGPGTASQRIGVFLL